MILFLVYVKHMRYNFLIESLIKRSHVMGMEPVWVQYLWYAWIHGYSFEIRMIYACIFLFSSWLYPLVLWGIPLDYLLLFSSLAIIGAIILYIVNSLLYYRLFCLLLVFGELLQVFPFSLTWFIISHLIVLMVWIIFVDWWWLLSIHYFGTHNTLLYPFIVQIWVLVAAIDSMLMSVRVWR